MDMDDLIAKQKANRQATALEATSQKKRRETKKANANANGNANTPGHSITPDTQKRKHKRQTRNTSCPATYPSNFAP